MEISKAVTNTANPIPIVDFVNRQLKEDAEAYPFTVSLPDPPPELEDDPEGDETLDDEFPERGQVPERGLFGGSKVGSSGTGL